MTYIAQNQLFLLILCFLAGCAGTAVLFRQPAWHRVWQLADLVWVVLGGLGAVAALVAGIYRADSTQLARQIDVAYAATTAFDRDAARFRLRFCDPAHDPDTATLCDKVEFLSASTANNADLPLFIEVTRAVAPLRGLSFLTRPQASDDMAQMTAMADAFDPKPFLSFAALDAPTQAAVDNMRRKVPAIAGDFIILARSYEELVEQIKALHDEWMYLQANAGILTLQIIALCVVAFAAPFRLGKSIVSLRTSGLG